MTHGVTMKITARGLEKTVVHMQYRSPLSNRLRECTMTMALLEDASDANQRHAEAKDFVQTLLRLRGADFPHEPLEKASPLKEKWRFPWRTLAAVAIVGVVVGGSCSTIGSSTARQAAKNSLKKLLKKAKSEGQDQESQGFNGLFTTCPTK